MTRLLLGAIIAAICGISLCPAQPNDSQTITNWGAAVDNVQLAINVTNKVIEAGAGTLVTAWTKNSSTNSIAIYTSWQSIYDFDVFLIDQQGTEHHVKPGDPGRYGSGGFRSVRAGSTNRAAIALYNWDRTLKPGPYTLKVKATFWDTTNGDVDRNSKHDLVSNLLAIQIKSPPPAK